MSNCKLLSIAIACVLITTTARAGGTTYVDADATGAAQDGSSWCDAYLTLQDALASAGAGDNIRIANGIYQPDQGGTATPGSRFESFVLIEGVAIKGGYAGCGAPDPNERDLIAHETVLSGDLTGNDGPDFANYAENSYHVVTATAVTPAAKIDGVTISSGNADDNAIPHDAGGGMRNNQASPGVIECTFSANSAVWGGGMENFVNSNPMVYGCKFEANRATFRGGGLHNNASSPTVLQSDFIDNTAYNSGGGMRSFNFSAPFVSLCRFIGNTAEFGAGVVCDETFGVVANTVFTGNTAEGTSGAFHNWLSSPVITNCTFSYNTGSAGGGIFSTHDSFPEITNCILWQNSDASGMNESAQIFSQAGSVPVVNHSCVQGWTGTLGGTGNFGDDPLLLDADGPDDAPGTEDDNLRLIPGSPCIDAGDSTAAVGSVDLDNNPRIIDGDGDDVAVIDIGAYEAPPIPEAIPTVSTWGLFITTLLGFVAFTIATHGRRRLSATTA